MHRGQRGPQVIRIGRSPLRKAPAGRYGPARTFVAVAPCGGDLSGTCFRCSPFSDGTFIRHLRMLRDTLLSGGSLSGTCARFEAHSSAAGLHPAPAHASGHTPQRQVFIRHLRMLRDTLLSGRSSSGTCACFGAHSSAAGLHPAPAPASRHTPQRTLTAASCKAGSGCRGRVPFRT